MNSNDCLSCLNTKFCEKCKKIICNPSGIEFTRCNMEGHYNINDQYICLDCYIK